MRVTLLEPFFTGSHATWAKGFHAASGHDIDLLTLPGRHWKWRMHGAAVSFAREVEEKNLAPDLWLATDMLDVSTFVGLTRTQIPIVTYFHENQLTYPWAPGDPDPGSGRDGHFHFINIATALASDRVWFNSAYHRASFLAAARDFLRSLPDHRELASIDDIEAKSDVMPLGMDLSAFDDYRPDKVEDPSDGPPVILWNHRWEYDKNPDEFFAILFDLAEHNIPFRLVVLGEQFRKSPPIFEAARQQLADHILHWGYADSFANYARWLWRADILPVTSNQDFFGGSVVEAMYCDVAPLLPNRLAYPEHAGSACPAYLYEAGELQPKLEAALQNHHRPSYREQVARYDWSIIAPQMDRELAEILN